MINEKDKKDTTENRYSAEVSDMYVDSNERQIGTIGVFDVDAFVNNGILAKGFGVLTDRRFYSRGKCLRNGMLGYYAIDELRTIDLNEITTTSFVYARNIITFMLALIITALWIVGIIIATLSGGETIMMLLFTSVAIPVIWLYYILDKKLIYEVMYVGGNIGVLVSAYGIKELRVFDKLLRRAKDCYMNNINRI